MKNKKGRKEMLDECNTIGKYIDSSFYDLNTIKDCVQYILDADDNYRDDFMYSIKCKPVDYYDEDYYITYHYESIPEEIKEEEIFWRILFLKSGELSNLYHIQRDEFLLDLEDQVEKFKDKDFKMAVKKWIKLQEFQTNGRYNIDFPDFTKEELEIYNKYMNTRHQLSEDCITKGEVK